MTIFNNRVLEATSKKVNDGYETTFKVRTDKMYADSLGKETKIGIHDWIEIGVFAKPAEGKKMGKALHLKKVLFEKMERSFTIHTKDEPYQVGVDPYYYLIDRVPSDNLKKISMN